MAVLAPVSGLQLEALARLPDARPLPGPAPEPKSSVFSDVVVFSSAPMRVLSDRASAGLRQLASLLPLIEQAVSEETTLALGHLSKAAGTAARQITEGHEALLAEGPDRVAGAMAGRSLPERSGGSAVEANPFRPGTILVGKAEFSCSGTHNSSPRPAAEISLLPILVWRFPRRLDA